MRVAVWVLLLVTTYSVSAQPRGGRRPPVRSADLAERAIVGASEELENMQKIYERDVKALAHLRAAQTALTDAMQPAAAIEKAYENVDDAKRLLDAEPGAVMQAIRVAHDALVSARRSPSSADFDRLRTLVNAATLPAARIAARNALELEEQILSWIKVQQLISNHLRRMSEIAGESLRAAQ